MASESKVILLVEDNLDDERLTLRALRRNNIMNEVVVACDGQEALDYLFSQGKFAGRDRTVMPAVVVLDLKLPKLQGIEVLRSIRANPETCLLPVVVLTANDDPDQMRLCAENGANSFVKKPSESAAYSEMILQLGMYWLLLNHAPPIVKKGSGQA